MSSARPFISQVSKRVETFGVKLYSVGSLKMGNAKQLGLRTVKRWNDVGRPS